MNMSDNVDTFFKDLWEHPENTFDHPIQSEKYRYILANIRERKKLRLGGDTIKVIPDSIGDLRQIKELVIKCQSLTAIPDSICDLKNLTEIFINVNTPLP